jgi:two-component system, sensor histidine kinase PdtaS
MKYFFIIALKICMLVQAAAQPAGEVIKINEEKIIADNLPGIKQMLVLAIKTGKTDTAAADKIFRTAIDRAVKNNDYLTAGKVYDEMGEMYFRYQNHNKSFGCFLKAKEYFVKSGAGKETGIANFKLGRQQYYRGNYKLASAHLIYAMRVAKQLQLKAVEADVLEYMGILYHVMPTPGYQSNTILKKALLIKQQLKDYKGGLHILEKIADIYYYHKKFDSALYYSNESILLAEKSGLNYDAALSHLNQVPILLRLNKQAAAKEKLLYIKNGMSNPADINMNIRYFIQSGNYSVSVQEFATAQKNYDTAIQIAQHTGFPELAALVYNDMAGAYYYNNDFKTAYEYQLLFTNQMRTLYSKENITILKELELILKTNSTEDEVKYLNVQNEIKAVRLKNEKTLRWVLITGAAALLFAGAIIFVLYQKQKRKNGIIQQQSAGLQTLMKEIHHRVKNNLQIISSLLDLQANNLGNTPAAAAIKETRNRVQTMVLIHKDLYGEKNINGIAVDDYINSLAQNLFKTCSTGPQQAVLKTDIEKIKLDADTVISIGLIMNELISNSLKYAFNPAQPGTIEVTLTTKNDILFLQVKDNGKGFPQDMGAGTYSSFGMRMIKIFAEKLKASLEIYNNNGACVSMKIKKYSIMP